jgi:hypothetical protein
VPVQEDKSESPLVGRYLLRYLLPHQVGLFITGSRHRQYVTPTAYAPEETISWLALPAPKQPRTYGLLLDARKMADTEILGPRWVRLGKRVEIFFPVVFRLGQLWVAGKSKLGRRGFYDCPV